MHGCSAMKRKGKRSIKALVILTFTILGLVHVKYLFLADEPKLTEEYEMPKSLLQIRTRMNSSRDKMQGARLNVMRKTISSNSCSPKSVVFVKTHKTASTTMTNIILRYAKKHKLSVGLPPLKRWELAGYPGPFNKKLIDPQLKQYQVLCHHFKMPAKQRVMEIVPENSIFLTIIRDPANAFESGFSFFRDYPYSTWLNDYKNPESLSRFLNEPEKYYNRSTPWYFRAKNYQAFDLGFNHEVENEWYIAEVLRKMDEWFDLVLITERMDESLILLKDLLCMESIDDVLYIRLKVRQQSLRRASDSRMIDQMRQWNRLDTAIYEHFLKKLEMRIDAHGRGKVEGLANELRRRAVEIESKCVLEYDEDDLRPWISRIRLRRGVDKFCQELSWGEVKFGDHIRTIQKKYVSINPEKQLPQYNLRMILDREQDKFLRLKGVKS